MIWLAKSLLWLLSKLAPTAPYNISRSIAGVWMKLSPGKRHVAEVNLRRCYPQLSTAEISQWVRESFVHYVCTVFETGRNWYWSLERLQAQCDGEIRGELFTEALETGRGVVVLAPHFGAWEYLGMYLQKFSDIAILYKPPSHAGLEKALMSKRRRGGANMIPASASGLRQLYAHLKAGKGAGVLPDQEPSGGMGRFVPFFGHSALTGVLASRLVQKTGCVVLFSVCERLKNGRYRVHVFPADEDIYSRDTEKALAAVNRGVEQCIAINPPQYLWSYKRFRSRPEGEPPFYS
jgi:KDO2-lipid IV(A) lauroyltransferase